MLAEACLCLGLSRFLLLTTEFKKIAPRLGRHMREASAEATEIKRRKAAKIGWAVNVMSRHTVWESKCLAQAMAVKFMLNRRRLQSTLYLGMRKDEAGNLVAHAWIQSCGLTLAGGPGTDQYTVLSVFGA